MKKLFSLLFAFILFTAVNIQAQVSTYTFSQSSSAYVEIVGDTVVAVATTTTTSGPDSMDDSVYPNNSLPFAFNFNGLNYSNVAITSNGFLTFGTTSPSGTSYTPISATTAYDGAISSYGRDLIGNRGITATRTISSTTLTAVPADQFVGLEVGQLIFGTGIAVGSTITALNSGAGTVDISLAATASGTSVILVATGSIVRGTTGAVGSRVHTIQFKRVRPWTTSANANMINFQIKLYETSNLIEVVYGTNTNSVATTGQTGLRGLLNSDFNNRTSATAGWASSSAGGFNTSTMAMSSTILPASGVVFKWTPFVQFANDVSVTENIQPIGGYAVGSPAITPSVKIKNIGTNSQTSPFYTIYKITGPVAYADSTADTIASGYEKTITFPSDFSLNTAGNYTVKSYTRLPGDQNMNNDTITSSFVVVGTGPDFGADSGYFYANNLATNQPSFPKWGWKDTSGSKSIIINNIVQPGMIRVGTSNDDAYFKLSLSDILTEFGINPTNKKIKLNGNEFDSLFVNTNGIIGLTEQFGTYSLNDFNIDGAQVPHNAILAFWHDVNFGNLQGGSNRLSYKAVGNQVIITYDRAVSFAPTTDWVTFQVVLDVVLIGGSNSNWRVTFADTTNQNTSSSFLANYNAQIASIAPAVTTFRNYMMGWTNTGATVYSGYVSSGNPFPASPVTQVNDNSLLFFGGKGLAVEFGPNQNSLNLNDVVLVCVSVSLEGLQSNNRVRDTVTVLLYDATTNPLNLIQSTKVFLDSVSNGGLKYGRKYIDYTALKRGAPVRIGIKHRNSITVYSANTVTTISDTLKYDFTTNTAQTYGGNSVVINGVASSYTGDVNDDGVVDVSDVSDIDNDANNFVGGPYVITDLNWDEVVDLTDAGFADNNAFNFVSEIKPPGVLSAYELPVFNGNYRRSNEVIIIPDAYAVPKIDINATEYLNIKKED